MQSLFSALQLSEQNIIKMWPLKFNSGDNKCFNKKNFFFFRLSLIKILPFWHYRNLDVEFLSELQALSFHSTNNAIEILKKDTGDVEM